MKLALTRAMLQNPDILMLDEPTNHLDVTNVAWLENYLQPSNLKGVSCIIVSHDSSFLDTVCTHIIHYTDYKLHVYPGNLSAFVSSHPNARSYYELDATPIIFKFPDPGFLEGIKTKDRAILRLNDASFAYASNSDRKIFQGASLHCSLSSRVAVLGPNGAGKSTLVKVLVGELEPSTGTVWRHPNLRIAYMAQHAFHHLEKHLDKTPFQYMQWRYATGEDREKDEMAIRQLSADERAVIEAKFVFNGEKRTIEAVLNRRKLKKSYEYEVKWQNLTEDKNTWFARDELEEMGFSKWVMEVDQREAARLGMIARPLTAANVAIAFADMGLDPEIALHSHIAGLSGGQKVKVVLAAAMWLNPHLLILDEPTNYLDRDSLGALAGAVRSFGGGVLIITHHNEFSGALCNQTWTLLDGMLVTTGDVSPATKEKVVIGHIADEMVDAFGNIIKVKASSNKTLSNKERKKKEKERKARRDRGEIVSSDDEDL
jgi:elongation factor 3